MTKQITVTEYAALREISRRGVLKAIQKGHNMPGIVSMKRLGVTYILKANIAEIEKYMAEIKQVKE